MAKHCGIIIAQLASRRHYLQDNVFETIKFDELDFLQFTEDDITLSQICDAIKKEEELIDCMHEISFGNEFDINIDIPVSPRAEMQNVDVEMFKDFDLDRERSTATNDFEENSSE